MGSNLNCTTAQQGFGPGAAYQQYSQQAGYGWGGGGYTGWDNWYTGAYQQQYQQTERSEFTAARSFIRNGAGQDQGLGPGFGFRDGDMFDNELFVCPAAFKIPAL